MDTRNRLSKVKQSEPSSRRLSRKKTLQPEPLLAKYTQPGVVLTCGQGDVGQLGLTEKFYEKKRFTQVDLLVDPIVQVVAGGMHTVCLSSNGQVWTFGCNDEGALGRQASDEDTFAPGKVPLEGKAVQISAGDSHSAALMEDGRAFIWGSFRDSHGAMRNENTPITEYLTPRVVETGGVTITRIASGGEHILFLTSTGTIYSAGCPEQGQLGRVSRRSATRDTRYGFLPLLKPHPVVFKHSTHFVDVWATQYGSFARERTKGIYVFGLNNYRQLGLEKVDEPIFSPTHSSLLSDAKYDWIKVAGGDHHTLLLDRAGQVYSLGRKEYGRLGLGVNCDDANEPTLVQSLTDKKVIDIACGTSVSLAVVENGDAFAWGFGSNGQLGCGDVDDDSWLPQLIRSKHLKDPIRQVLLVDAGGQHSAMLATNENH